ncbi:hypothetical protein [Brachybacterium subflavum]|uniref:hypothetical protein n=1 Tax=Brachybacterium subflavum TaxID=2585206 RepID=UPI0012666ACD|nr:hypothetical protein [Brachybacterium subflavum]
MAKKKAFKGFNLMSKPITAESTRKTAAHSAGMEATYKVMARGGSGTAQNAAYTRAYNAAMSSSSGS